MDLSLIERLDILTATDQISTAIRQHVEQQSRSIEGAYQIDLTEENAGSFVTHFAIACARIQKGEAVQETPESIDELVQRYPEVYKQAQMMFAGIAEDPAHAEVGFLTMYLCLLQRKE